jgi:hypothetical protein
MVTLTADRQGPVSPWKVNLTSVGSVEPPPQTDENAEFTRDRYEPVRLSVAGWSNLHPF